MTEKTLESLIRLLTLLALTRPANPPKVEKNLVFTFLQSQFDKDIVLKYVQLFENYYHGLRFYEFIDLTCTEGPRHDNMCVPIYTVNIVSLWKVRCQFLYCLFMQQGAIPIMHGFVLCVHMYKSLKLTNGDLSTTDTVLRPH